MGEGRGEERQEQELGGGSLPGSWGPAWSCWVVATGGINKFRKRTKIYFVLKI